METTKYVFLSQPMSGISENEVYRVRELTKMKIREIYKNKPFKVEFVSTYERPNAPHNASRFWYLGEAIKDIDGCNLIVFCDKYEEAKGCLVEKCVAETYGVPYIISCIDEDEKVIVNSIPEI